MVGELIERWKLFVSGLSKNISGDFNDALLSQELTGAEVLARDGDASIACDNETIVLVNSPTFRKHFLAKQEKEICIHWDAIAGAVKILHNSRVIQEVETSY